MLQFRKFAPMTCSSCCNTVIVAVLLPSSCDTWHQVEDGETDEEKELEKAGNLLLAT